MMISKLSVWIFGLVLTLSLVHQAWADEHIEYKHAPISLGLNVGEERQLVFGEPVQAGVTAGLLGLLKVSSVTNRVFVESVAEFANQRLIVRGIESGVTYIFTVQSVSQDNRSDHDGTINVYYAGLGKAGTTEAESNPVTLPSINNYPFLTRYAMQHLYAPERLAKTHPGIQQMSMRGKSIKPFRCTLTSTACDAIIATPVVGFKTDRLFITALRLENVSSQPIDVDPRLLHTLSPANLLTATSMHGRLLPKERGDKAQTMLVIIHDRPFTDLFDAYAEVRDE